MIDYGFGLRLDSPSYDATQDAFACLEDSMRSLNQSLSYFDRIPLLLDIEIKKTHSNRTPEVQLGIWQAAGYAKRKLHGWSTTMPMPGICINGHDWVAYITFEDADDRLVSSPSSSPRPHCNHFANTRPESIRRSQWAQSAWATPAASAGSGRSCTSSTSCSSGARPNTGTGSRRRLCRGCAPQPQDHKAEEPPLIS